MLEKALITAASNKFFPSLINLLGSIKVNYPSHPKIFIFDLGLFHNFRKELEKIENVEVLDMPVFCGHWRSCFTWKTYIFAHPFARLNFYLDSGCQVLKPMNEIFETIEKQDYFIIGQGINLGKIIPKEYESVCKMPLGYEEMESIHAGEIGFKAQSSISPILEKVYNLGLSGLALGFSENERWRNRGKDKNPYIRNCPVFRHDMTLLNMVVREHFANELVVQDVSKFAGGKDDHPEQVVWNLRLSYKTLDYIKPKFLHKRLNLDIVFNRGIIFIMIFLKNFKLSLKKVFKIIS